MSDTSLNQVKMNLTLPSKYVSKAVTYTHSHNKQHFRLLRPQSRAPGTTTEGRLLRLATAPGVSDIIQWTLSQATGSHPTQVLSEFILLDAY